MVLEIAVLPIKSNTALADVDDPTVAHSILVIHINVIGAMTINSVTCFSDGGTPSINIHRDGSTSNILSQNLTCSSSGATSTNFAESTLNFNDKLDFMMV